ncbi:MAG: ATP-binding protein [Planctomycetes bacterium]|nr:ATP-binding protein [Planctomycetota bacterium]
MYLSFEQIKKSHDALGDVHPFYFVTFLACKAKRLPIGRSVHFPMDKNEKQHLEVYFKPNPSSRYYYRLSKVGPKGHRWLNEDYASSGSQKTRTTTFKDAFIHKTGTDLWGWDKSYVGILEKKLYKKRRIPAFHLAVWLYRNEKWSVRSTAGHIQRRFFQDFDITKKEKDRLFETEVPEDLSIRSMFQDKSISWRELQKITTMAPDAEPEEGGSLSLLELYGIGPAKKLDLKPGDRINLITGDNALGKTFLLECAWWALSGIWAGLPAYPREEAKKTEPRIVFQICSEYKGEAVTSVKYDWETDSWPLPSRKRRPTIPGLIVYARVDGSFSVWDPARANMKGKNRLKGNEAFLFSPDEIWNGLESKTPPKGRVLCNGILRDWITWQHSEDPQVFDTFCKVLKRLSPKDLGALEPGRPTRLLHDARDIPTVRHSYGTIPIIHASAGVKRIIAIAYLLVWAWQEHKTQSRLLHKPVERRMVVLIDELEAHLHPQWQRLILPALTDVCDELDAELKTQFIIATHSPLVTASMEPLYDEKTDKLFHLSLEKDPDDIFSEVITLSELPFIRHGRLDRWLTSEVFELSEARSIEAENAIEDALRLQKKPKPSTKEVRSVSDQLMQYLAAEDSFWPRWICFAEKYGVEL